MPTVAAFNVKIGANINEFMRKTDRIKRRLEELERSRRGSVRIKVVEDLDRAGERFGRWSELLMRSGQRPTK